MLPLSEITHRRWNWVSEPRILFPFLGLIVLILIWGATVALIRLRHGDALRAAEESTFELSSTYEAQAVRALREVDQTLKLVQFWHERGATRETLAQLADAGLLPSALVFTVSVADRSGVIVETTRPPAGAAVADQDYFREQRSGGGFFVGRLPPGPTGNQAMHFSRPLLADDGAFDGVAIVAVDASYFVSGYDTAKLGKHGVIGLFGADGFNRVRRSGDTSSSGEAMDYAALVAGHGDGERGVTLGTSHFDGTQRWRGVHELYGFPLAAMVGLSVDEQMAGARHDTRLYILRAGLLSALILLMAAVLGRMSHQLAQSRARARDSALAQAQRVEYLAYHDALTGLPNRSYFSRLLGESIGAAQRGQTQLAVAFLDLDRFKQINDTLGHDAGDQFLQQVAQRLKLCLRAHDVVARLGGDEFVILLPDLPDGAYAAAIAQQILAVVAKPFQLLGQEFRVTVSIGISIYPTDGLDEQTLTKNADLAMYQAKAQGKNMIQFFSEALQVNSLERLALESSLRHALERHEFRLVYQAKRDITTGRITGMEALLRWEHPDLGEVAPMRFIPVAAESGLMVPIGKWVLRTACAQNVAWRALGLPPLSIAVNLTPQQFGDLHLLQDVTAILQSTGMEPQLLELEITESLLIQDVEQTLRIMTGLKRLGVRIAIDDFGCGFSTLATLQRFPLDTIKVDRSLIRDMAAGRDDRGLAAAIIAMGKSLSLTVVAQGVETREQAEFLQHHAFDELQGFYLKRPLAATQFTEMLLADADATTYIGRWPPGAQAG